MNRFRLKSRPAMLATAREPTMHQSVSPLAIKAVDIGEKGKFAGYLSVFGNTDWYGEIVEPGAWKDSIAAWKASGEKMPLLWQHMSYEPIGVWTGLEEDRKGLYAEGQILVDAGPLEARAWAHIRAGSLAGLSPGYYLEEWQENDEGEFRILKADLREGSVVTFPANRAAQIDDVKATALDARRRLARGQNLTTRQMEMILREQVGLPRAAAAAVLKGGYENWLRREADETEEIPPDWAVPPALPKL